MTGDAAGIARFFCTAFFEMMMNRVVQSRSQPGRYGIILVDDHAVVRAGYKRYIELDPHLHVVAEAATGEEAYALLARMAADLVIMDLSMPGQGGFDSLRRILNRYPSQRVLIFSMHENASIANQALRLGACGYLTKSMAPDEILGAIHQVMEGERPIAPALRSDLAEKNSVRPRHKELLPREFEIFIRLACGESIRKICESLNLSEKTAFNYQSVIRKKLNLNNGLEIQQYARAHGLLDRFQ